jgi:hypothetical protein
MSRTYRTKKNEILATRITPRLYDYVKMAAYNDSLSVSEWIRNLIISELKRNNLLPFRLYEPQ